MRHARLITGGALCLVAFGAQANLITNGDFATNAAGWTFNRNTGGDWGWRASGNPGGSFWINHNGGPVGPGEPDPRLFQSIATAPGQQYLLTFDYARVVAAGAAVALAVDVDGVQQAAFQVFGDFDWRSESLLFTAGAATSTISFRTEINGTDIDAAVDNVVVVRQAPPAVPEPGLLALLGLGLLGLGASFRSRT